MSFFLSQQNQCYGNWFHKNELFWSKLLDMYAVSIHLAINILIISVCVWKHILNCDLNSGFNIIQNIKRSLKVYNLYLAFQLIPFQICFFLTYGPKVLETSWYKEGILEIRSRNQLYFSWSFVLPRFKLRCTPDMLLLAIHIASFYLYLLSLLYLFGFRIERILECQVKN